MCPAFPVQYTLRSSNTDAIAAARLPTCSQTTLKTPNGHTIRYKENKLCETTPGTRSISGYVDLADDMHTWFQFFTARNNPETAPITMWTNGGPGKQPQLA